MKAQLPYLPIKKTIVQKRIVQKRIVQKRIVHSPADPKFTTHNTQMPQTGTRVVDCSVEITSADIQFCRETHHRGKRVIGQAADCLTLIIVQLETNTGDLWLCEQ